MDFVFPYIPQYAHYALLYSNYAMTIAIYGRLGNITSAKVNIKECDMDRVDMLIL